MLIEQEYIHATFISESKNRFIGLISLDGKTEECYIPCSSKLQHHIDIVNKEVLLTLNRGKNRRTKYSLFAVKIGIDYVVLNLNNLNNLNNIIKNDIIFNAIDIEKDLKIQSELTIGGYKTDLYIETENKEIIVEIKGVIPFTKETVFPKAFSGRNVMQLEKILNLLKSGKEVQYYIISMSPTIKKITLNQKALKYVKHLKECINHGMKLKVMSCIFKDGKIQFNNNIVINI